MNAKRFLLIHIFYGVYTVFEWNENGLMTYRTHIYGQKVRGLYVDAAVTRCNNPRNFMQKRFTKMIKMAVLLFKKKKMS